MLNSAYKDCGILINLNISPKNKLINKLVPGPAKETFKLPHFFESYTDLPVRA